MDPAVEKLRRLVRIPTVAGSRPESTDPGPFRELRAVFEDCFPRLVGTLEEADLPGNAMLWRWPGTDPTADPVVLMAHQDVVPVQAEDPWAHPAFAAEIVDGAIWGRGTLDDKGCLVAIAEAVERLLEAGVTPSRDVWLSFGADEEVMGGDARLAVEHLRRREVTPWFVLDEGGAVAADAFPGVAAPLAVVGTTEKGVATVRLSVTGRGGHASTPRRREPAARLARAIVRIDNRPFPTRVPAPTVELFARLASRAPRPMRSLLARAAAAERALATLLRLAGPETAAMVRTTAVTTTLHGAPADNVIPARATAHVNVRILVGDTVEGVLAHLRRAVRDSGVEVELVEGDEPSPVSPTDDPAFELIQRTIAEHYPDAVPTPYVMMAATDARHFCAICPRVYRFAPFRMSKEQRQAIHSYDERLGVQDFLDGVEWYRRLIEEIPG